MSSTITFQQDLAPFLESAGLSTEKASSLAIRCCAGFCYFKAMQELDLNNGLGENFDQNLTNFILRVYKPGAPGEHHLGVNHNQMVNFIYSFSREAISAIALDPLRKHWEISAFKTQGNYAGRAAYNFFTSKREQLNAAQSTQNTIKIILDHGGLAFVGLIKARTNGYIGAAATEGETPTHTFLVFEYLSTTNQFVYFDPDRRAFEDQEGLRPKEIEPIEGRPGFYKIDADFLEVHSHKTYFGGTEQEREGGIVVGLFRELSLA